MEYYFDDPTDVKLIILFIIDNFKLPISSIQISDLALEHSYTEYFSLTHALGELEDAALLRHMNDGGVEKFVLTDLGQRAVNDFKTVIPFTVREGLLSSIKKELKQMRDSICISAIYKRLNELEYVAECSIVENGQALFSISLNVGSEDFARNICTKFKVDPQKVYDTIIKLF